MSIECYTTVSDLALCQRCPALFAYKIHRRERSAWRVGIKGNGEKYGSVFHKEISEKFFHAASNPKSPLYDEINSAASKGAEPLEKVVREKFFLPFVETKGEFFSSSQILAMAEAVRNWIQGMLIFFENSQPVFLKPEVKLEGIYKSPDANLIIKGCYDALIFHPEKAEARLFEFKGFSKSDVTVSLSQSLIYAWLLQKYSGIIPSIEIIYLEEKKPEIFNSRVVRDMIISGLPGLFQSAVDVILLRRLPEIMQDKDLCGCCKFQDTCREDMKKIFDRLPDERRTSRFRFRRRRRGASLLSLMVFFMAAVIITAQVFFFSNISSQSVKEDRDVQSTRMQLAAQANELIDFIKTDKIRRINNRPKQYGDDKNHPLIFDTDITANYKTFYDEQTGTKGAVGTLSNYLLKKHVYVISMDIFDLNYKYEEKTCSASELNDIPMNERIFPAMEGHYLIRVHKLMPAGNHFMLQVLIESHDKTFRTKNYEEIWW